MQIPRALVLTLGLVGGPVAWAGQGQAVRPEPKPGGQASAAEEQVVSDARRVGQSFVAVAERLAPSVVRITARQRATTEPARRRSPRTDWLEGTPFERFFQDLQPESPPVPRTGMGSGLVIDDQGHILTNDHVVADADDLRVTFIDGQELPARLVGQDPRTDLAVIRVEGSTAKPAEFGDSNRMQVGDWVIAIGNPFGLDHSVTVGVLSAKGRYGFAAGQLEDFLQTDASINPGNSGGPLVNLDGQVVGINTMIAGLGTGVGFAVSESMARPIAQQLIEHGKVARPFVGILMQSLTPSLRQAIGEKVPERGALVSQVQPGSPAEEAGVQVGDIVVRLDGEPMTDSREVQRAVLRKRVGDHVRLGIWRDGKETEIAVKAAPERDAAPTVAAEARDREGRLGLDLQTLTADLASRLGLEEDARGVLVTGVQPGSPAEEAGLRRGDVIVSIDRRPVAAAVEAVDRLRERRDGGHLLRIQRSGGAFFVALPNQEARG